MSSPDINTVNPIRRDVGVSLLQSHNPADIISGRWRRRLWNDRPLQDRQRRYVYNDLQLEPSY